MKELLIKLNACSDAQVWAADKSWKEIYETCHRGDWLLWLYKKVNPDDLQKLTLAKGHCANTVRHLMKYERSTKAVDAAIAFGEGLITIEELNAAAAAAAYTAAAAAADANAAYAANAAAYAANAAAYTAAAAAADANAADAAAAADDAAYAAAYAAAYTAYTAAAAYAGADAAAVYAAAYTDAAADAAAYAAYAAAADDAAYAAARKNNQQLTADICRKYLPIEIWNIKTETK